MPVSVDPPLALHHDGMPVPVATHSGGTRSEPGDPSREPWLSPAARRRWARRHVYVRHMRLHARETVTKAHHRRAVWGSGSGAQVGAQCGVAQVWPTGRLVQVRLVQIDRDLIDMSKEPGCLRLGVCKTIPSYQDIGASSNAPRRRSAERTVVRHGYRRHQREKITTI
jgi:hypothetical protein